MKIFFLNAIAFLEKEKSIGNEYTIEEIESITRENPNKYFLGDIVNGKGDEYLVYLSNNKWVSLEDVLEEKINIVKAEPFDFDYIKYDKI